MAKEVVISNSRLNSYGFRVLTEGINIEQYVKNPILLWMHSRPFGNTINEVLPLGRMENLRIEGDNLIGTPVFDESDEFAMKIKQKWDAGILKMVSAGLDVLELSDSEEDVVIGQTRKTVKRSKLIEVSIVDIGANDDALALYDNNRRITLSKGADCGIELLSKKENTNKKENSEMKEIAQELGLTAEAGKEEILQEIAKLKKDRESYEVLQKEVNEYKDNAIKTAVEGAIKLKKITEDKREDFEELGKQVGIEKLSKVLNSMQVAVKPSEIIHLSNDDKTKVEKLSDLSEKDRVKLREENIAEYKRLYKAEYGVECEIE